MKLLSKLIPTRNPLLQFEEGDILNIGDCHLGRKFKNNVFLDRKGEYENKQYSVLKEQLNRGVRGKHKVTVQLGDWFDKAVVSNFDILESLKILKEYEEDESKPDLVIMSGNHDDSRSNTEPTSWDILSNYFNKSHKVIFVKTWLVHQLPNDEMILFVGWNINQNVVEAFKEANSLGFRNIKMVYCHLDRVSYGDDTNVIPYDFLAAEGVQVVVSGHEHKPYQFHEQGMQIIGTGSLLPYSHAEDTEGEHYITFKSLDDLNNYGVENLKDKHVRLYVKEEELDQVPDLKSISLQVNKTESDNVTYQEVTIEAYNAKSIWEAVANETGLTEDKTNDVWSEISEHGEVE